MRKGCDGGKREKKNGKEKKREKTDDYSGHYVIASSQPPERWPLERRTLMPSCSVQVLDKSWASYELVMGKS